MLSFLIWCVAYPLIAVALLVACYWLVEKML